MSLNEKLKNYYFHDPSDIGEDAFKYLEDEHVEAIKQAFIDAGWMDMNQLGGIKSHTFFRDGKAIELMTGPEWLARFEKYAPTPRQQKVIDFHIEVQEAARRAAGVDE